MKVLNKPLKEKLNFASWECSIFTLHKCIHTRSRASGKNAMKKCRPWKKIYLFLKYKQAGAGRFSRSAGRASDVIIEIGKNIVYLFFILQLFRVFFCRFTPLISQSNTPQLLFLDISSSWVWFDFCRNRASQLKLSNVLTRFVFCPEVDQDGSFPYMHLRLLEGHL